MSKTLKIYSALLVLLFLGVFAIEFSRPQPIDWSPTFNETHKKPYGTYILFNELSHLFASSKLETIKVSPYEYFDTFYSYEDSTYSTTGNYLYIDSFVSIDEASLEELYTFASHGNTVFIAASHLPEFLKDTLLFETKNDYDFKGEATLSFANQRFANDSITIEKGLNNIYFDQLDSTSTTVLGYQKFDTVPRINFVKLNVGHGNIFIHLQPIVFTNYHLLKKQNKKYASTALSYLPEDTIFFDSKNKIGQELGSSIMRFILTQPALRWAWYLGLAALLLFMFFNAKRKQRIVKVIKPLENTTVDFAKTIGNLYYETKDHNNLIEKKITYFLEYLRRVYYLDTQVLDEKFVTLLSLKSGKDKMATQELVKHIHSLRAKKECSETDLIKLNKAIEDFHTS